MHLHKYQINLCPAEPRYIPFLEQLIIKLLSSADNIHEQFGVRSGPTVCLVPELESIQFDTLIFFLKFHENIYFEKESADDNKITKYVACKDLYKKCNAV